MTNAQWETYLADHQEQYMQELFDFLRIPSISALPEHAQDVWQAGEWVADRLRKAGMENVQVLPTGGHPVVSGHWLHAPGKPTVLIYGHFDTQPVDPIDLWDNPPFEPFQKDGRIYARGVSDDKGNLLSPILAVEALLKTKGSLPVNVKFFIEGQEEIGSPQLAEFLVQHHHHFECDLAVSADGLQWSPEQSSLEIGMKGLCAIQLDVRGPSGDLHSGLHGGVLQNPIHALVQILASMRSLDGQILVKGFYDDVIDLSDQERREIAQVPYDEDAYKQLLGVDALYGEPGYTTRERNWTRPTLEVNGIWGGFQGSGTKTVIPSQAHAKITCRLVSNQSPDTIGAVLQDHVRQHKPQGVTVEVLTLEGNSEPYLMPADYPGNLAALEVLQQLYGKPPYYTRSGGTIPVCALFLKELGVYTVSFGFSLPDEQLHAPNEYIRISSLERGQKAYALLLEQLARFSPEDFAKSK